MNLERLKDKTESANKAVEDVGVTLGNIKNRNLIYGMDKFNTLRGHGFAAERANHQYDIIHGKNATIVGDDNVKNGADRIVNGCEIQTKFCRSGSKCIAECFDERNQFRYIDKNGQPMQIEVPNDKYSDAVKALENRINRGQVSGVDDPERAKEIVKKSPFTYEQAKNIAKFGTVESLKFDAINGTIISTEAIGISATIAFAIAIWNGKNVTDALDEAIPIGLKTGGITFFSSVLSSQLIRSNIVNTTLRGSTDFLAQQMGSKLTNTIANTFRKGGNIYGAAARNNVSKLLRGNIVTGAITVAVMSSGDVIDIFQSKISSGQLFKNIVNTTSSVAGGCGGWTAGASAGAAIGSVVPVVGTGVGTFVGAFVGACIGSSTARSISSNILDCFIEDDAKEMLSIIKTHLTQLSIDYILLKEEVEEISNELREKIDIDCLKKMFSCSNKEEFANELLVPIIEGIVSRRKYISVPSVDIVADSLSRVVKRYILSNSF